MVHCEGGKKTREISHATTLEEAQLFVKKAREIEHELHLQVCAIWSAPPHGQRGYSSLTTIADCVRALNSHEKKIREYTESIRNSKMGLNEFNQTLQVIAQHVDSVSHMVPIYEGRAKTPEEQKEKKRWWRR